MYSPLVVGASNTHNSNMAVKKSTKRVAATNHRFTNLREVLLTPGPGKNPSQSPLVLTAAADGTATLSQILTPVGLTSSTLGPNQAYVSGTYGNVTGPALRGLYNKAIDFGMYRVSRARLIFVGGVGSTATGQITLAGYSDPYDVAIVTAQVFVSGPNTKTFDLASSSSKELSVPIPVDSSWKKVSSILTVPGNGYPFKAADSSSIAVIATVADLSFGAVSISATGTDASKQLGTVHIEYDVEFKDPIDFALNL